MLSPHFDSRLDATTEGSLRGLMSINEVVDPNGVDGDSPVLTTRSGGLSDLSLSGVRVCTPFSPDAKSDIGIIFRGGVLIFAGDDFIGDGERFLGDKLSKVQRI